MNVLERRGLIAKAEVLEEIKRLLSPVAGRNAPGPPTGQAGGLNMSLAAPAVESEKVGLPLGIFDVDTLTPVN